MFYSIPVASMAMNIICITLFPEIFKSFLATSIVAKAYKNNHFTFTSINPRNFADPPHHHVDDTPYGGGPGMVLKPEPLFKAIEEAKQKLPNANVIALTPTGKLFTQTQAKALATQTDLIFLCGRYEGIDQRVLDNFVDKEISIGDYVTMGGEIPLMAIMEATLRLLPDVLGNELSHQSESFENGLLEAPQYTKPAVFRELPVPEVLLSGDHGAISKWREQQSKEITAKRKLQKESTTKGDK